MMLSPAICGCISIFLVREHQLLRPGHLKTCGACCREALQHLMLQ